MGCKVDITTNPELVKLMNKYGQAKGLEIFLRNERLQEKSNNSPTATTDSIIENQHEAILNFIKRDSEIEVTTVKDTEGNESHHYIYNGVDLMENSDVKSGSEEAMKFTRKKLGRSRTSDKGYNNTEASELGTLVHSAMQHVLASAMIGTNPEYDTFFKQRILSQEEINKNPKLADAIKHLKQQLSPLIKRAEKEGAIILPEVSLVNLKTKIAGTIDILIVNKDGSVDIVDLKTTTSNKSDFTRANLIQYDRQVGTNYAGLVNTPDGMTTVRNNKVDKTRLLLARIDYLKVNGKKDKDRIGNIYIPVEDNGDLKETPLPSESTGIEELDTFLGKINNQIELDEARIKNLQGEKNEVKRELLRKSITNKIELRKKIQAKRDVKAVKDGIIRELEYMKSLIIDNKWDDIDIERFRSTLQLYSTISEFTPFGLDYKDVKEFYEIEGFAKSLLRKIKEVVTAEIIEDAKETGIIGSGPIKTAKDFLKGVADISLFKRLFLGTAHTNNPIVAHIRRLVSLAKYNAFTKSSALFTRLEESKRKVTKILGSGVNMWEPFIQLDEKSKPTGRIINEVNDVFYKEAKEQKKEGNSAWFLQNTIFNKELYEKRKELYIKFLETQKRNWERDGKEYYNSIKQNPTDAVIFEYVKRQYDLALGQWIVKHAIIDENGEILGSMDFYKANTEVSKGKWYDKRFDYIKNNSDLFEFWELYTNTMLELKEIVPEIRKEFIANIPANYAELVLRLGVNEASKLKIHSSTEDLFSEYDEKRDLLIDESLGNPVRNIPIIGLKNIFEEGHTSVELKSYDLANSLYIFADSVYKFAELSDIEEKVKNAASILSGQDVMETDNKGNFIHEIYGRVKKSVNSGESSSTLSSLNQYIRAEIYGVKKGYSSTVNIPEIKIFGKTISKEKELKIMQFFDRVLKYVAVRNLGLNMFAPVTNTFQGYSTALITGTGMNGSKFYKKKNFVKASYWVTTGKHNTLDKDAIKMQLLMEKIGITQHEFVDAWKKDLSSIRTAGITTDLVFKPMQWGDTLVQNSILGAMLLDNTYNLKWDDFSIKQVEKNGKSEYELVYKDGTQELSNFEASRFKAKVMSVNAKVVGDYDSQTAIKQWYLGRALMQHRTWIPAMFQARFSKKINKETSEGWDYEMERWMEGRYTTMFRAAGWQILGTILKNKLMLHKIDINDFEHLDVEASQINNVKANLVEAQILAGLMLLLLMLKGAGEGEEDRSFGYRYGMRTLNRLYAELSFFFNPNSAMQILISPAASISAYRDFGKLFTDTFNQSVGYVIGDEEMMEKAKPLTRLRRIAPTYQLERFYDFLDNNKLQ